MWRRVCLACLVALVGALAIPAGAGAVVNLTAIRTRIGDHPAFVRAVVDFTDGTFSSNEVVATDPSPFDGAASLRLSHLRVRTETPSRSGFGITVRVLQGVNRVRVEITAVRGRFKYLAYSVITHDRLAIDLWKSRPPSGAAEIRQGAGGCLTLSSWHVRAGAVSVAGRERGLFEHQFQVVVRGTDGRVLGQRSVIAAGGRWSTRVRYRATRSQVGTLEAVDASAKDGALACLAQVRVTLPAAGAAAVLV